MTGTQRQLLLSGIDGSISEEDFPALCKLLSEDADALQTYCEEALLHGEIEWHYDVKRDMPAANQRRFQLVEEERSRQQKRLVRASLGIAALIVISLGIAAFVFKAESEEQIVFRMDAGAVHRVVRADTPSLPPTAPLSRGDTLVLDKGKTELLLPDGVRSLIEAPAIVVYEGKNSIRLDRGKGYFHIFSEKAKGFRVRMPSSTATDLGTRFGILSNPGSPDEIHVFEGTVDVLRSAKGFTRQPLLKSGNSVREDDGSPTGYSVIPQTRFTQQLDPWPDSVTLSFDDIDQEGNFRASDGSTTRKVPVHGGNLLTAPGVKGDAIRFDGSGTHLGVDSWKSFATSHPGTIAMWVRPDEMPGVIRACPISWGDPDAQDTGRWSVALEQNPGSARTASIRSGIPLEKHVTGNTPVTTGGWSHLAFVFENTPRPRIMIYVNGRLDSESFRSVPRIFDPASFVIGNHISPGLWGTHAFSGAVDEIVFYADALSPAQIQSLQMK